MTLHRAIAATAILTLAACTGPQDKGPAQPLPERVVLQYDFSGDWMATAGDQCTELSGDVLLTIAGAPDRGPSAFRVTRFLFLKEEEKAKTPAGFVDENGVLHLVVETTGPFAGRTVETTLSLRLQSETPRHIRLTAYTMTIREQSNAVLFADLLANAVANPGTSVLSKAGEKGLCLKRL